jgi:hypothetical protein
LSIRDAPLSTTTLQTSIAFVRRAATAAFAALDYDFGRMWASLLRRLVILMRSSGGQAQIAAMVRAWSRIGQSVTALGKTPDYCGA